MKYNYQHDDIKIILEILHQVHQQWDLEFPNLQPMLIEEIGSPLTSSQNDPFTRRDSIPAGRRLLSHNSRLLSRYRTGNTKVEKSRLRPVQNIKKYQNRSSNGGEQ